MDMDDYRALTAPSEYNVFERMHNLPPPPTVDYTVAFDEIWEKKREQPNERERAMSHIGIIVSKTGHDRGQKEMYLYSPTAKRHDGLIVCSSDFLNFEVGEWIHFQTTKLEVYMCGRRVADPYPTGIKFDTPKIQKVRACIYPDDKYAQHSLICRKQTYRCWSPDLGDLFIDNHTLRSHADFGHDAGKLFYVTVVYHFNASVFFHEIGGPEPERRVYWIIHSIDGEVTGTKDGADFALAPWRPHVWEYLQRKWEAGKQTFGVPPWYMRSARVLTEDMIMTWKEEAKTNYGVEEITVLSPLPVIIKDNGDTVVAHPKDLFDLLDATLAEFQSNSRLISKRSWKNVMSHDGKMLEPGSRLPPVSTTRRQKEKGERVELVQDSAGLFMSKDAALSYVEIKEKGTNKLWTTGGWKNRGEAWDAEAAAGRWDKNLNHVDEIPYKQGWGMQTSCASSVAPARKNLLGAPRMQPKKTKTEEKEETKEPSHPLGPLSSSRSSSPPSSRVEAADNNNNNNLINNNNNEETQPAKRSSSFASAAKIRRKREEESTSSPAPVRIDFLALIESQRSLSSFQSAAKIATTEVADDSESKASPSSSSTISSSPPSPPSSSSSSSSSDVDLVAGDAAATGAANAYQGRSSELSSREAPLIPAGCECAEDATELFQWVFEQRYCVADRIIAPRFFKGPLQAAVREAFDCPEQPESEGRPLALYIHHDGALASNLFPQQVLCDPKVVQLLRAHFIVWPWDVTMKENEKKLGDWLGESKIYQVYFDELRGAVNRFPLLMLITKDDKGRLTNLNRVESTDTAASAAAKLDACVSANAAARAINPYEKEWKELAAKYKQLQKHVAYCEEQAYKEPADRGFTAPEFIRAQQAHINVIGIYQKMGLVKDNEETRKEVAEYRAKMADMQGRMERGEIADGELVEIHLKMEDDAKSKDALMAHVDFQKDRLEAMRVSLREMRDYKHK